MIGEAAILVGGMHRQDTRCQAFWSNLLEDLSPEDLTVQNSGFPVLPAALFSFYVLPARGTGSYLCCPGYSTAPAPLLGSDKLMTLVFRECLATAALDCEHTQHSIHNQALVRRGADGVLVQGARASFSKLFFFFFSSEDLPSLSALICLNRRQAAGDHLHTQVEESEAGWLQSLGCRRSKDAAQRRAAALPAVAGACQTPTRITSPPPSASFTSSIICILPPSPLAPTLAAVHASLRLLHKREVGSLR